MAPSRALSKPGKENDSQSPQIPVCPRSPLRNTAINMRGSVDIHTGNNTAVAYFTTNRPKKQQQEFSGTLQAKLWAPFSPKAEAALSGSPCQASHRTDPRQGHWGEGLKHTLQRRTERAGDAALPPAPPPPRLEISTTFLRTVIKYLRKKLWNVQ